MRRRDVPAAALGVPFSPAAAAGQGCERVSRIAVLTANDFGAHTLRQHALPELARAGVVEGHNHSLDVFSAKDAYERLPTLPIIAVRGTPAGDLPIENPTTVELVVNLGTVKAHWVDIPSSHLAWADEVVE
jgi:hypothetical protein